MTEIIRGKKFTEQGYKMHEIQTKYYMFGRASELGDALQKHHPTSATVSLEFSPVQYLPCTIMVCTSIFMISTSDTVLTRVLKIQLL